MNAGRDLPRLGAVAAIAVLGFLPMARLPAFYDSFLYLIFFWVSLSTSWALLSGFAGYFSLGHAAFFGVGLYTTAVLTTKFGWPFLPTLPVAAAIPALLAVGIGAIVFRLRRLRGELFALLTLSVTFVIATIILNTPIDGGGGIFMSAVPLPAIMPTPTGSIYLLGFVICVATLAIAWTVAHSRLGMGLFAIHDDEDVAEAKGVPTFRYKMAAFALSAGIAGLGGGLLAMLDTQANYQANFSPFFGLVWLVLVVTVSARTVEGAVVAGFALALVPELLKEVGISLEFQYVLFGLGALTYARHPEGILEAQKRSVIGFVQRRIDRRHPPAALAPGAPEAMTP